MEQEVQGLVGQFKVGDQVGKQVRGCRGVIEGVVPSPAGMGFFKGGNQAELPAQISQSVGGESGPSRPGQQEGINPGPEGMSREGAQEALFGPMPVGHKDPAREQALDFWPE